MDYPPRAAIGHFHLDGRECLTVLPAAGELPKKRRQAGGERRTAGEPQVSRLARKMKRMVYEKRNGNFLLSTNAERLDIDVIHAFLAQSYWARGIPRELVERAIAHSLCFGLYEDGRQIGFARAVTDYARFANIMDVFVLEEYRGRGLGKWMLEGVMEHLASFGLFKIMLNTNDAQEFYRQFGFNEIGRPQNCMEALFEMPWFVKV